MSERGVFVYIIRAADDQVKVGTAKSVEKRLRQLQGANPLALSIEFSSGAMMRIIAEQVEFEAHHRLREYHLHGEWFGCSVDLAKEAIAAALKYVRNKRSGYQVHTQISRNLRTAKPRRISKDWLS